jgi:DNA-3-methyladenine glycosylase II
MLLSDVPAIAKGIKALTKKEPGFAQALADNGPLKFEHKPDGFQGLIRIILGQQVSVLAAQSIWRKLEAAMGKITPKKMAAVDDEVLRGCGLSRQKIRYCKGLANDVLSGALDIEGLKTLDDEAAVERITRCIGLGRWTAENYLLFCEARADLFPAKDLAILIGLQMLQGSAVRPTPAEAVVYAQRWKPYRSAASLLIWHHYMGEVARRKKSK